MTATRPTPGWPPTSSGRTRLLAALRGHSELAAQQPPEYLRPRRRLIFNAIGHNATSFAIYADGSVWGNPAKPPQPKSQFDAQKAAPAVALPGLHQLRANTAETAVPRG